MTFPTNFIGRVTTLATAAALSLMMIAGTVVTPQATSATAATSSVSNASVMA